MNKIIATIVLFVVVFVGGAYLLNRQSNNESPGPGGQIVISITDEAVNMKNVSEVMLTVSDIQMRNQAGEYVTVSDHDETYSLLELDASGKIMLYADTEIPTGTYDKVRVAMDGVTVVTKDGTKHKAVMPEDDFGIESTVVVKENSGASTVIIDFLASESLHRTEEGTYVFAPVVKLEARSNAEVKINTETGEVTIVDGKITTNTTVGVTLSGDTKLDYRLGSDAKLEITKDGTIQILGDTKANATIESPPLPKAEIKATIEEVPDAVPGGAKTTLEIETQTNVEATTDAPGSLY